MVEMSPRNKADKFLAAGFQRAGPSATALTDPIADTPMIVTLDQLRPYDHDPRVKRNPAYEEIKASIRERGLDAPPAITRRPSEVHYIIRNGGNTRLAILRELWAETKQERFFRMSCLFRPWPERGEIAALTGHLAENELRGGLTFIERALGVEKAREFYEQETGSTLTQSELARRLTADGYPVQQSRISRMQEAVCYLLPAIPTVLYGGLGRHQVERLAVLRKACEHTWERRALGRDLAVDFASLFQDVLSQFDAQPDGFSFQRVQDELAGQMAELLDTDYDTLSLEIDDSESRQRALSSEPLPVRPTASTVSATPRPASPPPAATTTAQQAGVPTGPVGERPSTRTAVAPAADSGQAGEVGAAPVLADHDAQRLQGRIVSPAPTTERLVGDQLGDRLPDCETNALRAIPVQVGGLYPVSDVWYIEPGLDVPDRLRVHIAQFAREVAEEAAVAEQIEPSDDGIGFVCVTPPVAQARALPDFARAVLALLHALSMAQPAATGLDRTRLADDLAPLLHGGGGTSMRLSDTGLVKLFRLLRLARRLLDLENGTAFADRGHDS
ncbi:integrating conjugative element ParB [Ralstonia pickettii DTP0602]|nr:integrating conjugative element ParB [Ralstonia pickettii DTP0602]